MALTPAQARAAIDAELAPLWTAIQTRQAAYLAANGRYWQGLRLLSTTPADGVDAAPDQAGSHPGYQVETWTAFLGASVPASLAASVWIDQYVGPSGPGYTATVEGTLAGNIWRRCVQVGPESYRAFGWTQQ